MGAISKTLIDQSKSGDPSMREKAAKKLGSHLSCQAVDLLAGMLTDADNTVVHQAARSLAEIGSGDAIESMIVLLDSENARLRNLAIEILSRIGEPALPRVTELLGDLDPDVRKFAIDILKSMTIPDTRDALIRSLYDNNVNVAADAAEILGDLRIKSAVPFLIECMQREPWLRCAAMRSLGKIGGKDAVKALLNVSQNEESIIVFCVVTALGDSEDPRGINYLADIFKNQDPILTFAAAHALEKILTNVNQEEIQRAKALIRPKPLISMLQVRNIDHIGSAVRLLGIFKEKSAIPVILNLYKKSKPELFTDIENALSNIGPDQLEPLIDMIKNPMTNDRVKISMVRLLRDINGKKTYEVLEPFLKDCSEELAVEIIHTMAGTGDQRAVERFHDCLDDPLDAIRKAAAEGLAEFAASESLILLVSLAMDESSQVRRAAATSLQKYGHDRLKETIQNLLKKTEPRELNFGLMMIKKDHVKAYENEICRLCSHKNAEIKKTAIRKTGFLKTRMAFESITPLIEDKDAKIRRAVIRVLENFSEFPISNILLNAAESDNDVWNRYEAIKIIGKANLGHLKTDLENLFETSPEPIQDLMKEVIGGLSLDH